MHHQTAAIARIFQEIQDSKYNYSINIEHKCFKTLTEYLEIKEENIKDFQAFIIHYLASPYRLILKLFL